jgi:flagellar P-ring protein FlgI
VHHPLLTAILLAILAVPPAARAAVRLENICTIEGQYELTTTGLGLVVGLDGTGDGARSIPTIRTLESVLRGMNYHGAELVELKEAKNVAVVLVTATVPKTGLRRGQRIDCSVSSFMGAKSLRGGRLLPTVLVRKGDGTEPGRERAVAVAAGEVETSRTLTTGTVFDGAQLELSIVTEFVKEGRIRLLLDEKHAGFHAASEIARVVNGEFSFEANGRDIARATQPGVVEVRIVDTYVDTPVDFIAELLDVAVENPSTRARVVVNPKTNVVVVTGEVEISPVVITHENLTITVGGPPPGLPEPRSGFVPVTNDAGTQAPQRLQDLVTALNALKVPTEDVIEILRTLDKSGKLHAEFVEN